MVLRSNVICNEGSMAGKRCVWIEGEKETRQRLMEKYFGVESPNHLACDFFLIDGVPAASFLYDVADSGKVFAKEFHFNKALLLLYDAGPCMRQLFYQRHKKALTKDFKNKIDFLTL